jgi:Domain of unknown function (DUF3846)
MRVLVYSPDKVLGEERTIENKLGPMQEIVGGYIETVTLVAKEPWTVICNEEGRLKKLPFNRAGILGTFLVVRRDNSEFASLTDTDIRKIRHWLDDK